MFNKSLFMHITKANIRTFMIITGVLCLLIAIIMTVFDPETMKEIATASKDAPVNPLGDITTLIAFISNQYFGNFALIFAMIYSIIVGNKLIADQIDKGSMAYHLSTPITRTEYTFTSAIYFILSLVVMFALVFVLGVGIAELVQPGELPIQSYFFLTLGSLSLHIAFSSISFFASCLFNRSSRSIALGAGLILFFFATSILSGMSESLSFLENVTLISLFDSTAIIQSESFIGKIAILLLISTVLYIMGMIFFKKKDLPL
jgi:ABC-2 type transport system permease protein